jgi:DNA-directed RNA polymerase subunit RPC12/RpoP
MNEMCSKHGQRLPDDTKRVRCPECGRRVMARLVVIRGHDRKVMPPHKVKGWYKKPRPKKKEKYYVR